MEWRSWLRKPFNTQWMDQNLLRIKISKSFTLELKNKARNEVFNLNKLVMYFQPPKAGEMVTPRAVKMQALLTWCESQAKRFSKMTNETIPWKEHKLEKWLRASYPCQLLWIPIWQRWSSWIARKKWGTWRLSRWRLRVISIWFQI